MRAFLSLFLPTTTATGLEQPPKWGIKVLLLVLGIPCAAAVFSGLGHPEMFSWYILLTLSAIYDSFTAQQRFWQGRMFGREELADQMWEAWVEHNMDPGDYLLRETYFAGDEKSAARQVRRPAQPPYRPSGPTRDT